MLWVHEDVAVEEEEEESDECGREGLGVDVEGQASMTDDRIEKWVKQVKEEFGV